MNPYDADSGYYEDGIEEALDRGHQAGVKANSLRSSGHTTHKKCSHSGCEKTFPEHVWGQIKAHDAGWFFQKNGDAWCADHHPEWVSKWRAGKKEHTDDWTTPEGHDDSPDQGVHRHDGGGFW